MDYRYIINKFEILEFLNRRFIILMTNIKNRFEIKLVNPLNL